MCISTGLFLYLQRIQKLKWTFAFNKQREDAVMSWDGARYIILIYYIIIMHQHVIICYIVHESLSYSLQVHGIGNHHVWKSSSEMYIWHMRYDDSLYTYITYWDWDWDSERERERVRAVTLYVEFKL